MKKISLTVIMLLFVSTFVYADELINFNERNERGDSAPMYDVINSTSSVVEFELEIPGMQSKDVDSYDRVYIPEHTKMDSVGFPEVPMVTYLTAIPECECVR